MENTTLLHEMTMHLNEIYKKSQGAEYYKTELHTHTPGSEGDYKLFSAPIEEIAAKCAEKGIIPTGYDWRKDIKDNEDWKKWAISALIVTSAYMKDIRIIVITDHDTMSWYNRIRETAKSKSVRSRLKTDYTLKVLPGVEITAHSNYHIIAIIEPKKYELLELYLEVLRYKKTIGKPASMDEIINEIENLGGIVYFPHVDQNDIEPSDIKKTIFSNPKVMCVNFKNEAKRKSVENFLKLKDYRRETPLAFVQDSDSHCPDEIGKSPVWLKMTEPGFDGLKSALKDPEIRVRTNSLGVVNHPYIMGMAFLDSPIEKNKNHWHYIRFSPYLNCFIGARGTGKSTIINWITTALCQELDDGQLREWFGTDFGRILLFAQNKEQIYIIDINPQSPVVRPIDGKRPMDVSNWIEIFRFQTNGLYKIHDQNQKQGILDNFRTESFRQTSVEELANNSNKLHSLFISYMQYTQYYQNHKKAKEDFISGTSELHKLGYDLHHISSQKFVDKLKTIYIRQKNALNDLKLFEEAFADDINKNIKNRLLIKVEIEENSQDLTKLFTTLLETNLSELPNPIINHIIEIAVNIIRFNGFHEGIIGLFEKEYTQIINDYNVLRFTPNQEEIDNGIASIQEDELIDILRRAIIRKETSRQLANLLKLCPSLKINLMHNVIFDVNKKETDFKDIRKLSLGQKCVAILTLILQVSEYLGDRRTLIIDQPEDHLDNRYIFEHLVKDLRKYKTHRQIILSSHNPNIPVCADAEQILVLTSNGKKCWVDKCGSIDYKDLNGNDNEMTYDIQTILEGGVNAFKMRQMKYCK